MIAERDLIFYRAGLLDPAQAFALEEKLRADPELQARLLALDGRWSPESDELSVPSWRIPPPGIGAGAEAGLPAVMGEDRVRPGDRFMIRIGQLSKPRERRVVVLRRGHGGWDVVYPTLRKQEITLAHLPIENDGSYRLDLAARRPLGRQRWAVALPMVSLSVDWGKPPMERWAELQGEVATGQVPVSSVEIEVVDT